MARYRTLNNPHMIYTDVQSLEEAVDLLMDKKNIYRVKKKIRHPQVKEDERAASVKITLPKLKFGADK